MMKAAIYSRFSTDMQRDESIEDQVRGCKKFITQEDWQGSGIREVIATGRVGEPAKKA